jgi:transcriptional regulator with XRE-family HTH domain
MPNNQTAIRSLPEEVLDGLRTLGEQVSVARRRRRQTQEELATRMGVEVRTLRRLESGDPGVGLGVYASALWALGLLSKLVNATAPAADDAGTSFEIDGLPRRVRPSRPRF